jgi:hypothetical protein
VTQPELALQSSVQWPRPCNEGQAKPRGPERGGDGWSRWCVVTWMGSHGGGWSRPSRGWVVTVVGGHGDGWSRWWVVTGMGGHGVLSCRAGVLLGCWTPAYTPSQGRRPLQDQAAHRGPGPRRPSTRMRADWRESGRRTGPLHVGLSSQPRNERALRVVANWPNQPRPNVSPRGLQGLYSEKSLARADKDVCICKVCGAYPCAPVFCGCGRDFR